MNLKRSLCTSMLILIVLSAILVLAYASSFRVNLAYACSCAGQIPVSEYVERSSSTFVGAVEDIGPNTQTGGYDVKFSDVSRIWGTWINDYPSYGEVTVWTSSLGSDDCGYPFEVGQEYLVYTQREESTNILKVDLCNGTKPVDQAQADLQVLGTGTNPMIALGGGTSIPATHSGRLFTAADFIMPALYAGGAAAAGWMFVRYRRKGDSNQLAAIFAGIGIGFAFVLVFSIAYGGYFNLEQLSAEDAKARENEEHLTCSSISGFWPYNKAGLAESIGKESDVMILVGTITNVETRLLDFNSAGNSKIPLKVVTLDVEKYLIDENGNYSQEITFRAPSNACYDNRTGEVVPLPASFASDPASDPDKSAKYKIGDRSLIEIHRWPGDEYKAEGLDAESTIKLDIDENGFVKVDYRTGIFKPIKIEELENEIAAEIDKLNQ